MPNTITHMTGDLTLGKVLFGILFVAGVVLVMLAEMGVRG
jgi:hypothetical protein